jgi:hypothetical protein
VRGWWDFGAGALGDMGCHIMDMPMALGLTAPDRVEAVQEGGTRDRRPFGGRRDLPVSDRVLGAPVKFVWYCGVFVQGRRPPAHAPEALWKADFPTPDTLLPAVSILSSWREGRMSSADRQDWLFKNHGLASGFVDRRRGFRACPGARATAGRRQRRPYGDG